MVTRKQLIISGGAVAAAAIAGEAYIFEKAKERYEMAATDIRRPLSETSPLQRELVRFATLAPSSHNTQCWKFQVAENKISILPDMSRRCPAVDPDDHHLFVSLGCAVENLLQASVAHGLKGDLSFGDTPHDELRVSFVPSVAKDSALAKAIPLRQCTRCDYDGKSLSTDELNQLEIAGRGSGVSVHILTDQPALENILEYTVAANTAQMNDAAFVSELKTWIRFSDAEALRTGDGLFSR